MIKEDHPRFATSRLVVGFSSEGLSKQGFRDSWRDSRDASGSLETLSALTQTAVRRETFTENTLGRDATVLS